MNSTERILTLIGWVLICVAVACERSAMAQAQMELPIHYLTWTDDPCTTMTVHWVDREGHAEETRLRYRASESEALQPGPWKQASGSSTVTPFVKGHVLHTVLIRGLEPDTRYEVALGDVSEANLRFQTLPRTLDRPLRFIVAGDTYAKRNHRRSGVAELCRVAAKHSPRFAVLGGDAAYTNDEMDAGNRWLGWLDIWSHFMVTPDGLSVPILFAVGNHEAKGFDHQPVARASSFYTYAHTVGIRGYSVFDIGSDMSIFLIDSGHTNTIEGEQTRWLERNLEKRRDRPLLYATYHRPAYRGTGGGSDAVRRHWMPLFEQFGLNVAFEHDTHCYKRTHRLREGQPASDGVLYLGDGGMGEHTREPLSPDNQAQLAKTSDEPHFILAKVTASKQTFRAITLGDRPIDHIALVQGQPGVEVYEVSPKPQPKAPGKPISAKEADRLVQKLPTPVALWSFNGRDPGQAVDSIGGHHGRILSATDGETQPISGNYVDTSGGGGFNFGLRLDGERQFVRIDDPTADDRWPLDLPGPHTIIVWARVHDMPPPKAAWEPSLIGRGAGRGWGLTLYSKRQTLYAYGAHNGLRLRDRVYPRMVESDRMHFIAYRLEGKPRQWTGALFFDPADGREAEVSGGRFAKLSDAPGTGHAAGPILMGANPPLDQFLDITLDEVRIYNTALNDQQIQALYHAGPTTTDGRPLRPTATKNAKKAEAPELHPRVDTGRVLEVPRQFRTIADAVQAAAHGDQIRIEPGVYRESVIVDKSVHLAGAEDDRTVVEGLSREQGVSPLRIKAGMEVLLTDLTIRESDRGVFVEPASRIELRRCELIDHQRDGLYLHHGPHEELTFLDMRRCLVARTGDGVDFNGSQGWVLDSIFRDNRDDGIDLDGNASALIYGCHFLANGDDGIEVRLKRNTHAIIAGCTFDRNGEDGLEVIDTYLSDDNDDNIIAVQTSRFYANGRYGVGFVPHEIETHTGDFARAAVFASTNEFANPGEANVSPQYAPVFEAPTDYPEETTVTFHHDEESSTQKLPVRVPLLLAVYDLKAMTDGSHALDCEGVAVTDQHVYVVDDDAKTIYQLDRLTGARVGQIPLAPIPGSDHHAEGPEGLSIVKDSPTPSMWVGDDDGRALYQLSLEPNTFGHLLRQIDTSNLGAFEGVAWREQDILTTRSRGLMVFTDLQEPMPRFAKLSTDAFGSHVAGVGVNHDNDRVFATTNGYGGVDQTWRNHRSGLYELTPDLTKAIRLWHLGPFSDDARGVDVHKGLVYVACGRQQYTSSRTGEIVRNGEKVFVFLLDRRRDLAEGFDSPSVQAALPHLPLRCGRGGVE